MTSANFSVSKWAAAAVLGALGITHAGAQALSGVVAVDAGYSHTCVVTDVGGVKCWGGNGAGQLGDGTTTNRPLPVDVQGLPGPVASVSAGSSLTCAVLVTGAARCWGVNNWGQLGNNATTPPYSGIISGPVEPAGLASGVAAIAAGEQHACALTTGGGVKCWGSNLYGQLGDGSTVNHKPFPVDVHGLAVGVVAIATSTHHTCALTTAGTVKCWGAGAAGQLGSGLSDQSMPVDVTGLSGVTALSAGAAHTCAVTSGGGAKCWGSSFNGVLGNGSGVGGLYPNPVDVAGLASGATDIGAGGFHTCAAVSGGVKCWGTNAAGEVGDGSVQQRHTPVDVLGLGSGVQRVSTGSMHTCALLAGGTVKCWGENTTGQLGNGIIEMDFGAAQPVPNTVGSLAGQTVAFAPLPMAVLGSPPLALAATATSGLPVAFLSLTPDTCSLGGSTLTLAALGVCTVGAYQSGDAQYQAASMVVRSFAIVDGVAAAAPRLVNISTRGNVLGGQDVLIGGFVIGGSAPKTVFVRARGPSLAAHGVQDALADPQMQVSTGVYNNNWFLPGPVGQTIESLGLAPPSGLESGAYLTLQPGAYTVIVSGVFSVGTGMIEVFEVDRLDSPLVNISTRAFVATGDNVLIGGFVVQGADRKVVVRARGPSLAPFGIVNPLANPTLMLVRSSDQSVVAVNDDWTTASNAADITASGFAPSEPLESAILVTLPPGAYTAIVSGAGATTGVGIVEVFAAP